MRGFELTEAKERFFFEGLAARPYPAQVVWGAPRPGRSASSGVARCSGRCGVEKETLLPAKHFPQEDQAPAIAEAVAALAAG